MTPDGQGGGRSRTTQLIVLAVLGALLVVGAAIAISQSAGDDDEPEVASGDVQEFHAGPRPRACGSGHQCEAVL